MNLRWNSWSYYRKYGWNASKYQSFLSNFQSSLWKYRMSSSYNCREWKNTVRYLKLTREYHFPTIVISSHKTATNHKCCWSVNCHAGTFWWCAKKIRNREKDRSHVCAICVQWWSNGTNMYHESYPRSPLTGTRCSYRNPRRAHQASEYGFLKSDLPNHESSLK